MSQIRSNETKEWAINRLIPWLYFEGSEWNSIEIKKYIYNILFYIRIGRLAPKVRQTQVTDVIQHRIVHDFYEILIIGEVYMRECHDSR